MALTNDEFKRVVEEFKETGHDHRFRDQLVVQEFSFSMIAVGILLRALNALKVDQTPERVVLQLFGLMFLAILTLHLRNINQDRLVASLRKAELAEKLEFLVVAQNVSGKKRMSGPRQMVRFTACATIVWGGWILWPFAKIYLCRQP
jgi:hypothetical protein